MQEIEILKLLHNIGAYLEFQREIGVESYTSPALQMTPEHVKTPLVPIETSQPAKATPQPVTQTTPSQPPPEKEDSDVRHGPLYHVSEQFSLLGKKSDDKQMKYASSSLPNLMKKVEGCTGCRLHETRNHLVFGDGNPQAELMFIGEAPGYDEDMQGQPFVGRAGNLLDKIIAAMGLRREDVYIANIIKCRPPENRDPEADEIKVCRPILLEQIRLINPKYICLLGLPASRGVLKLSGAMKDIRGKWYDFYGIRVMVTYHPAALLRNPHLKAPTWEDIQRIMAEMGLKRPNRN